MSTWGVELRGNVLSYSRDGGGTHATVATVVVVDRLLGRVRAEIEAVALDRDASWPTVEAIIAPLRATLGAAGWD